MSRLALELHPLCSMFPRICGAEYDELRDDIAKRGLDQPIVLLDNQILDGRHRYEACLELDVPPVFTEYQGGDPLGFVLAANVKRRHMTAGQQASMMALAIVGKGAEPAAAEEKRNIALVTETQAAKAAGVSRRTMQMAKQVAKADPKLAEEVVHGTTTLPEAVEQVSGKRPGRPTKSPLDPAALARELDAVREERDQLAADNAQLIAENEAMGKIVEADDKLAAAHKLVKDLQAQVKKLEARIAGLQREKNAAISVAKSAQRKVAKK